MKKTTLTLIALFAALQFSYAQNTNPWPSTGSVGIGTTSPAAPLHIVDAGTSGVTTLKLNNRFTFSGDGVMKWGPSANYGLLSWDTDKAFVGGQTGANLLLLADNSEKVRIATNGNVGIGTTSPGSKLDVSGTIRSTGDSNKGLSIYSSYSNANNRNWAIANNWDNWGQLVFLQSASNGSDPISGANARLSIDVSGNVGVNTTDTKGYKFAVNGSAIATSMKVKPSGSWPDFVFLKDYKLPTLTEVKTYIDKNQHLPDMPSADEVHKNGLDLGEMNRLLLKKVEELTLYLIEKDQQLLKQQQKADSQETRISALEAALVKSKTSK